MRGDPSLVYVDSRGQLTGPGQSLSAPQNCVGIVVVLGDNGVVDGQRRRIVSLPRQGSSQREPALGIARIESYIAAKEFDALVQAVTPGAKRCESKDRERSRGVTGDGGLVQACSQEIRFGLPRAVRTREENLLVNVGELDPAMKPRCLLRKCVRWSRTPPATRLRRVSTTVGNSEIGALLPVP